MGTRIQKNFGFLATLLTEIDEEQVEDCKLSDLFNIATESEKRFLNLDLARIDQSICIRDFFTIIDSEYSGLANNLIIFRTPRYSEGWSRSNSPIDLYEQVGIDATAKVQYIHDHIFPYTEPRIVASTKQELSIDEVDLVKMIPVRLWNEESKKILESKGLDLTKDIISQTYMRSPIVIRLMARILGVVDESDIRPAIVTHWS